MTHACLCSVFPEVCSCLVALYIAPVPPALSSLSSRPISATSFLIIMTWLVVEVLMVVSERGVSVEEKKGEVGGREGGWVRLLLLDC